MQSYRLYLMVDGHIRSAEAFEAPDDEAALAHAETLRRGQPAELWNRSRVVRRFEVRQDA